MRVCRPYYSVFFNIKGGRTGRKVLGTEHRISTLYKKQKMTVITSA